MTSGLRSPAALWRRPASKGGANDSQRSPARRDTADFSDTAPGNLHTDYLLPAAGINIIDSQTFWPTSGSPLYRLTGDDVTFPLPSSDHRLIWADLRCSRLMVTLRACPPSSGSDATCDWPTTLPSGQRWRVPSG